MKDKVRIRAAFIPKLENFYKQKSRQPSQVSAPAGLQAAAGGSRFLKNKEVILKRETLLMSDTEPKAGLLGCCESAALPWSFSPPPVTSGLKVLRPDGFRARWSVQIHHSGEGLQLRECNPAHTRWLTHVVSVCEYHSCPETFLTPSRTAASGT